MTENEFKEKARKHLFNCSLNVAPVVFEMYVRSFKLSIDVDKSMGELITIIRQSKDTQTAFTLMCHYLDSLEEGNDDSMV
jgi:hypothetical protein